MKKFLVSLVISLSALAAQATPIAHLPVGSTFTFNKKLVFQIAQSELEIYRDEKIAVFVTAYSYYTSTGLIVNGPVTLSLKKVAHYHTNTSGDVYYKFSGVFNKRSLAEITVVTSHGVEKTIANYTAELAKAGITLEVPAPYEE